jgi:hypothetical protein
MKSQLNHAHVIEFEGASSPEFITIPLPDNFNRMDLSSRISHIADELKALESSYPVERDNLRRFTSLTRIGEGKATYSVEYLPIPDSDY